MLPWRVGGTLSHPPAVAAPRVQLVDGPTARGGGSAARGADLLEDPLQRTTDALTDPLAAPRRSAGPVTQRMVALENPHRSLYSPPGIGVTGDRFGSTLEVLMGGEYNVNEVAWAAVKAAIWPHGAQEGAPLSALQNQYQHPRKVHVYQDVWHAQGGETDDVRNLLLPHDMAEAGDPLPGVMVAAQACVIQALEDFQVDVPGRAPATHAVADWHAWSREQGLDYRTDSDIARVYVEHVGATLVGNRLVTMDAWPYGDGRFLIASYVGAPNGAAVGHMIGVVYAGGARGAVHDQQNLTRPTLLQNPANVYARYVYQLP